MTFFSIIKSLSPKNEHGLDKISVKMIEVCEKVTVPQKSLLKGKFLKTWKIKNIVPIHKGENLLKNYRSVSLLYIFSKFSEHYWEQPCGLRRCDWNWKAPGSNHTSSSVGYRHPSSLRGSRWPSTKNS